jgi:hypothetical protein
MQNAKPRTQNAKWKKGFTVHFILHFAFSVLHFALLIWDFAALGEKEFHG